MLGLVRPVLSLFLEHASVAAEVREKITASLSMSAFRAWQLQGWSCEAMAEMSGVDVERDLLGPALTSALTALGVPERTASQVVGM